MDYELFLRDIEEDEELRAMVNLYKDPKQQEKQVRQEMIMSEEEEEAEEDFPHINVEDLLDDMENLNITDADGDVEM